MSRSVIVPFRFVSSRSGSVSYCRTAEKAEKLQKVDHCLCLLAYDTFQKKKN